MTIKPKCWVCEAEFSRKTNRYQRACSLVCGLELNYLCGVLKTMFKEKND